jgi:superfamily I DNA/RNA helicase
VVKTAPELMLAAALELTQGKRFDPLVVDEAQDFADSWWQPLVASLRDPDTARIATFRDDHQAVFGRRGRPSLDFAKVTLSKNLRTTRQIAAAYAPLFPGLAKAVGTDGPEVTFVECAVDAVIGVASDCAAQLLEEGWAPRDIALLTTFHRHPVHIEQQQHGSTAYWANLWNGDDIFYCTASGFKGLERPAVVVAVDGFRETQEARELLYVAMSRARDKLIVVADRETLSSLLGRAG